MDDAARSPLLQRRRMLQLRLQRQQACAQARALARRLCERGIRFSKSLPAAYAPAIARFNALPGLDERVDWPRVPGGQQHAWEDAAGCVHLLDRALRECGVAASARVLVVFHPAEAALVIGAGDLCAAWAVLHPHLHEVVWIAPRQPGDWVAEVSLMDRDLAWLKA